MTTFRTQVDYVIGGLDYIKIVFDDHDGMSVVHQSVEAFQQAIDVGNRSFR